MPQPYFPHPFGLARFLEESNQIEGINRAVSPREIGASFDLLGSRPMTVERLERFVGAIEPGMKLRRHYGRDVEVGGYKAPKGGPQIERQLERLLRWINEARCTPFEAHLAYELLHPFMDGNGRSGRMLYAWQWMNEERGKWSGYSWLHHWYYESLNGLRKDGAGFRWTFPLIDPDVD